MYVHGVYAIVNGRMDRWLDLYSDMYLPYYRCLEPSPHSAGAVKKIISLK